MQRECVDFSLMEVSGRCFPIPTLLLLLITATPQPNPTRLLSASPLNYPRSSHPIFTATNYHIKIHNANNCLSSLLMRS